MVRFKCENPQCLKLFHYTAKLTTGTNQPIISLVEKAVCPYCHGLDFLEYVEPVTVEQIESVYIYELGSGPQTVLDGLLAQGYRIVNRYAKTYSLEKPKLKPTDNPSPVAITLSPEVAEAEKIYEEPT